MATKKQKELYELLVHWGLPIHIAADVLSKGRLNTLEIKVFTKILKHVIPITGRILAAEVVGGVTTGALLARGAVLGTAGAVGRSPWTVAAALLIAGYIKREELAEVGAAIADDPRTQAVYEELLAGGQAVQQTLRPFAELTGLPRTGFKSTRKVSKADRAVKQAMSWLKAGTKAATGAAAGTLPGGAFRIAVKAAGMANPKTKSKPGIGKSIMNKIARRLKKWW